MPTLTYQTAGESHGPANIAVVTGMPHGVRVDLDFINNELRRRQGGYGRGARQRIEADHATILSGVRGGLTIGSPVTLHIPNADSRLDDPTKTPPLHTPRPGHADLAGAMKLGTDDCRNVLERASARETAARVAAGALAHCYLRARGVETFSLVRSVHTAATTIDITEHNWRSLIAARDASSTYCPDPAVTAAQEAAIRQAKIDQTTVGGVIEAHVFGVPIGTGSCMDWRDRLDARLAYAAMSIQAIKGVEIGLGFEAARRFGHEVHDAIQYDAARATTHTRGFLRPTNNAGGLEGGMACGSPIVIRAAMKPISTLLRGMPSVNLQTLQPATSDYERSDVCAVPAASVVLENVVAFEVAAALLA